MKATMCAVALIVVWGWGLTAPALSDTTGAEHGQSVESVLEEIRASQGIGRGDRIDCAGVTDEQLEELGEALMSIVHPDPEEHALMDRMMGGE